MFLFRLKSHQKITKSWAMDYVYVIARKLVRHYLFLHIFISLLHIYIICVLIQLPLLTILLEDDCGQWKTGRVHTIWNYLYGCH